MLRILYEEGESAVTIGQVFDKSESKYFLYFISHVLSPIILDVKQVIVDNFIESMDKVMRPFLPNVVQHNAIEKKRVGVLISGSGTNLQALIDTTLNPSKHMGAEIVVVISNKPDVEGLKRAQRAKIPTKVSSLQVQSPNFSHFLFR